MWLYYMSQEFLDFILFIVNIFEMWHLDMIFLFKSVVSLSNINLYPLIWVQLGLHSQWTDFYWILNHSWSWVISYYSDAFPLAFLNLFLLRTFHSDVRDLWEQIFHLFYFNCGFFWELLFFYVTISLRLL